ncbi:protein NATD1-like isoform X1 [Dermacentor silvarum]|uniref:protein NATD1-like isoform X1 n=1 Tax=Dermacentor silvarum TaxID=543639 RepID=UPI001896E9FA|nr:protein NATD1-like isoform X1 [Dermacentor silvarum]
MAYALRILGRNNLRTLQRAQPTMTCARNLSQESFEVEHDTKKQEFFIKLGKDKAVLQYEVIGPKTLDLVHTEVPESLRGKGIAKHLAKAALDYVAGKDMQARITCPYVGNFAQSDTAKEQYQNSIIK